MSSDPYPTSDKPRKRPSQAGQPTALGGPAMRAPALPSVARSLGRSAGPLGQAPYRRAQGTPTAGGLPPVDHVRLDGPIGPMPARSRRTAHEILVWEGTGPGPAPVVRLDTAVPAGSEPIPYVTHPGYDGLSDAPTTRLRWPVLPSIPALPLPSPDSPAWDEYAALYCDASWEQRWRQADPLPCLDPARERAYLASCEPTRPMLPSDAPRGAHASPVWDSVRADGSQRRAAYRQRAPGMRAIPSGRRSDAGAGAMPRLSTDDSDAPRAVQGGPASPVVVVRVVPGMSRPTAPRGASEPSVASLANLTGSSRADIRASLQAGPGRPDGSARKVWKPLAVKAKPIAPR